MTGAIVLSVARTSTGRNVDGWVRSITRDEHGRHRECRYRVQWADGGWTCSCGITDCEHVEAVEAEVA